MQAPIAPLHASTTFKHVLLNYSTTKHLRTNTANKKTLQYKSDYSKFEITLL
jgi:hypothetical protein